MIFLSSFSAGLSAALPDYFLEKRITYIMYSLGGLCIVCAGTLPAGLLAALRGGIFLGARNSGEGGATG